MKGEVDVIVLRKLLAGTMMVVGIALAIRGSLHSLTHGLPFGCIILSAVIGGLIFALGLLKWSNIGGR